MKNGLFPGGLVKGKLYIQKGKGRPNSKPLISRGHQLNIMTSHVSSGTEYTVKIFLTYYWSRLPSDTGYTVKIFLTYY